MTRSTCVLVTRIVTSLTVAVIVWQFVTAGDLLGPTVPAWAPTGHSTGAIVLHVVTGLAFAATLWATLPRRGPWWPPVLGGLVFVGGFVQAFFGSTRELSVHVPGAVALTVGSVWLAAWSFLRLSD